MQCHQCTNATDSDCSDPFWSDSANTILKTTRFLQNCIPLDNGSVATSCVKIVQNTDRGLILRYTNTVKPVYNDHPRDTNIVTVVDRWSLFRGHLCSKSSIWEHLMVVVVDNWSPLGGGR
jgi:hypothetical protein